MLYVFCFQTAFLPRVQLHQNYVDNDGYLFELTLREMVGFFFAVSDVMVPS